MISVDTNVVVRFLTRDDLDQYARARRIFETEEVFVLLSVLLESEWVLQSTYEYAPTAIIRAFEKLSRLPNVHVEHQDCLFRALQWHADGLDFADALHLASSQHAEAFATFDGQLGARSEGKGRCEVRVLQVSFPL